MSQANIPFESGQCFTVFLRFQNNDGSFVSGNRGKSRPIVIIQDPIDQKFYAFKVTGQIHKPLNKRYGYQLGDWKESGFSKETIVKCNDSNRYEIDQSALGKSFGKLSNDDLKGFLTKLIKVRKLEQQNETELER